MKSLVFLILLTAFGSCDITPQTPEQAIPESRKNDIIIPSAFGKNIKIGFGNHVRSMTVDGKTVTAQQLKLHKKPVQRKAEYSMEKVSQYLENMLEDNITEDELEFAKENKALVDDMLEAFPQIMDEETEAYNEEEDTFQVDSNFVHLLRVNLNVFDSGMEEYLYGPEEEEGEYHEENQEDMHEDTEERRKARKALKLRTFMNYLKGANKLGMKLNFNKMITGMKKMAMRRKRVLKAKQSKVEYRRRH